MEAPYKIYVDPNAIGEHKSTSVTTEPFAGAIPYIRKDKVTGYLRRELIPSIKPLAKRNPNEIYEKGVLRGYRDVLNDIVNDLK